MKHITTENFSEALTGNSLVIFHRLKGCPNCDKMLPLAEEFVKEGVQIFALDADQSKDVASKYAPQGNWNLPLTVYLENGKVMNVKTGIIDLMDATKTLQNIDGNELTEIILTLQVEFAQKRRELFQAEKSLANVMNEDARRKNPIEIPVAEDNFILPNVEPAPHEESCPSCQ